MTAKTSSNSTKKTSSRSDASHNHNQVQRQQSSSEPRRANKPLMEKRRRARINQSLAVLKTLILDSAKNDNTKHSKLEKADILELTVRHFQRHRNLETPGVNKYRAGYSDCMREVQRYLETPDAHTMCVIEAGVRQRLLHHLENCIADIDMDICPPISTPTPAHAALDSSLNGCAGHLEPSDEKNVRSEADSSTEQINNSSSSDNDDSCREKDSNFRPVDAMTAGMEPEVGVAPQHIANLPNNVVRMYDGNFVFVLPSHYIQLAAALGISLNNPVVPVPVAECSSTPEAAKTQVEPQKPAEMPLDFSKNEESDSMWRPW